MCRLWLWGTEDVKRESVAVTGSSTPKRGSLAVNPLQAGCLQAEATVAAQASGCRNGPDQAAFQPKSWKGVARDAKRKGSTRQACLADDSWLPTLAEMDTRCGRDDLTARVVTV